MSQASKSAMGDYALLTLLAKGGMAETYLAERGGKRLVLKKLKPGAALDDDTVRGFIDEARLCSRLQHPNVAQVFDFGKDAGELFLAMEFVHGRSLQQFIQRADRLGFHRLPATLACFIAARVLEGLHHAHTLADEQGHPLHIVHRDVSPENVLVSYEGEVKVIDFGIAKAELPGRGETAPGLVKGKYQYLSPEQATAQPLDARSDVFSTAIVLYLMLVGRLPFEGQPHEAMHAIARGEFPRPRTLHPGLAPELEAVLLKGLAKQREERYPTAQAMREDLEAYLARVAPGFGPEQLKELMQFLYYDELQAEGVPLPKRTALEVNLSAWRDPPPLATEPSGRPAEEVRRPVAGRALAAVVGATLLLLGLAGYKNCAAARDADAPPPSVPGPPPQVLAGGRPHPQGEADPAPQPRPKGGSLGDLALHALLVGNAAEAYSEARGCLTDNPGDLDCLYVAGASAVRMGNTDEGRVLLEQLVSRAPNHPKAEHARRWLEHGEHPW